MSTPKEVMERVREIAVEIAMLHRTHTSVLASCTTAVAMGFNAEELIALLDSLEQTEGGADGAIALLHGPALILTNKEPNDG